MTNTSVVSGKLISKDDYREIIKTDSIVEIADIYTPNSAMRVAVKRLEYLEGIPYIYTKDNMPMMIGEDRSVYLVSPPPIVEPKLPGAVVLISPINESNISWSYITRASLDPERFSYAWRYPDGSMASWPYLSGAGRIQKVLFWGVALPSGVSDRYRS